MKPFRKALASILRLDTSEGWPRYFFGVPAAGQTVNVRTAMQVSAVWACVRLLSQTISTLSLDIMERQRDGTWAPARDQRLQFIVDDMPNADSTASVFWEAMIAAMLLQGNGVAERRYDVGGRLIALEFLPWSKLTVHKRLDGTRQWLFTENGIQREIAESRIFRVAGFTLNGDWGLSAIEYGAAVFGGAMAAANSANSTFEKGLAPTIGFKYANFLRKEQREEFRETFENMAGAINAGKPVLMEGGMDAVTIGIKPSDAQLLESRAFSIEEICRWFGVPPHMVGHSEKSTSWGSGIEQQMIGFLTFTLRPLLKRVEGAISKDLMTAAERTRLKARYNVEDLLRTDSKTRAEFLRLMVSEGIMTRDEARLKENLKPKGGNAAVLTVNSANMPIDKLGTTPEATV
ncbi:MAG: phage portal protein [Comamonas sp.]|uniref:phage portal protein n=1 Tax=Comamonas sp. TaxID=34028 RepID=UPI002FC87584